MKKELTEKQKEYNHQRYLNYSKDRKALTYDLLKLMQIPFRIYKHQPKIFSYIYKFASYYITNKLTIPFNQYTDIINKHLLRDIVLENNINNLKIEDVEIDLNINCEY